MTSGEGYLRQRTAGSWTLSIYLGKDNQGKPKQMTRTIRGTKSDAQAEMARLVLEQEQGVDLKPQTLTFEELAKRWLDSKRSELADVTTSTYEGLIRVHVLPVLGKMKVRDIRPLHIEAVKAAAAKAGRTQKSALNVFRRVDAILRQAVLWQLIARNPCDAVKTQTTSFCPENTVSSGIRGAAKDCRHHALRCCIAWPFLQAHVKESCCGWTGEAWTGRTRG